MSKNRGKQRRVVVLDGSNIVAQGAKDGNDGNILISAIEYYQNLGYRVIPVMKSGTVGYMSIIKETGHAAISQLRKTRQLRTFDEGDDEGIIQIALKIDAWIITYDTFWNDKEKDGETIPSERKAHPEWDWDDIDSRTRGTVWNGEDRPRSGHHWRVVDSDFFDPTMPKAPKELLSSEYAEFREDLQMVIGKLNRIASFLEGGDSEINKRMLKKTGRIASNVSYLMEMVPPPKFPDEATVNKLLLDECKGLIRQINEIDPEAKLTLSGKRDELRARINEYIVKANADRAKADKEERSRLEELQEEREAAAEAGMKVGKYRKSLKMKAEKKAKEDSRKEVERDDWEIIVSETEHEFSEMMTGVIEEFIGKKLESSAKVSLDNKNRIVKLELPISKEERRSLIKEHWKWKKTIAQNLGLTKSVKVLVS